MATMLPGSLGKPGVWKASGALRHDGHLNIDICSHGLHNKDSLRSSFCVPKKVPQHVIHIHTYLRMCIYVCKYVKQQSKDRCTQNWYTRVYSYVYICMYVCMYVYMV